MLHLAIIMDGNGRWANAQNKPRHYGHKEGAKKIKEILQGCLELGVTHLSLYAFSTENWKRPKSEVDFLMKLLERYLKSEKATYIENKIAFKSIGDLSMFSNKLQRLIYELEEETKEGAKLTQYLALNYGAKDEIIRTFNKLNANALSFSEENIKSHLDNPQDVDILIRTGGDYRLSNFLLWQCAYAELFFTKTLWPDFSKEELEKIIQEFHNRERRFGGLN
ncbi:di-trans,poly-cis-decaprenylcistransferase [Helicobacter burdigaliensis]|uniref:di-trans,poly-cis-decaprenylcistransferase n=1 Tax=Helicobacter burdigaliensis TaxID=2315334 RepID=UPI000EF716BC|nr:di-trans,poly-cis-decaprenylcistransferase [Helicobacter burdigaliensis]